MGEIQVDRKKFLATVGAGALAAMTPEDKAEELEHYMIDVLEGHDHDHAHGPHEVEEDQERPSPPRGTGNLFQPSDRVFEPMPDKPTLVDFFNLRFVYKLLLSILFCLLGMLLHNFNCFF